MIKYKAKVFLNELISVKLLKFRQGSNKYIYQSFPCFMFSTYDRVFNIHGIKSGE